MSRKMTKYSTKLKTKLVLEVLKEERTLNEIASENYINPKTCKIGKRYFLKMQKLQWSQLKL